MSNSFKEHVALKFQLYNSLFLNLPFGNTERTGTYLPLLNNVCEKGFNEGQSPSQIIQTFFNEYFPTISEKEQNDILFQFIQYIERQVVLFDSVEDAAFNQVHHLNGPGTVPALFERARTLKKMDPLKAKLKDFSLRIVLTAHPTQFYPGSVLGIITDLGKAIQKNDTTEVDAYLKQLGKTPFLKKTKPTPYDEAVSLCWYLENIFYPSISKVIFRLENELHKIGSTLEDECLVEMGFWPGGDRDGNPFVNADISRRVANRLRRTIQILYFRDIRELKRRLTFPKIYDKVHLIEKRLYDGINKEKNSYSNSNELLEDLRWVKNELEKDHQGLFVDKVRNMITKVKVFGMHLATLDIRQDSSIYEALFNRIVEHNKKPSASLWNEGESGRLKFIDDITTDDLTFEVDDPVVQDLLECFPLMEEIQKNNGSRACHRMIISNSQHASHIMMSFRLAKLLRHHNLDVDIVPLFETIDDLRNAKEEMSYLYNNKEYREHLATRGNVQTIMLGFSDGTKDGGYMSANWSIFKAKENLTEISRSYGIEAIFFDGRGGPPARGGGNTHRFYASLGNTIEDKQVQLTIQGQTISSNFGTIDSAQFNIEQLLTAGLENAVFSDGMDSLSKHQREILEDLGTISLSTYVSFKHHPYFLEYLEDLGTLPYYGETNIGSRPVKRAGGGKLTLAKLRAIPFVGSWSQMKQNVPGFFGLGTALAQYEKQGKLNEVQQLYQESLFFKTLVQNSMMALSKCYFPLTSYLKDHEKYGEIWNLIHDEFQLTKRILLKVTQEKKLLESAPDTRLSITLREQLVLPLLTIQQYALTKSRTSQSTVYHKMILRTMFGIINASRNSA